MGFPRIGNVRLGFRAWPVAPPVRLAPVAPVGLQFFFIFFQLASACSTVASGSFSNMDLASVPEKR